MPKQYILSVHITFPRKNLPEKCFCYYYNNDIVYINIILFILFYIIITVLLC